MPESASPAPPNIRLIYFDIRGFAEPLRWMLKIAKEDFVDERIPLDAWAGRRKRSSIESLKKEKDSEKRRKSKEMGATLERFKSYIGQLPILFDYSNGDEFIITQTLAVMRYLARRYGFNGSTALEEARFYYLVNNETQKFIILFSRADEVADLVYDLRLQAVDYEGSAFKSQTPDIVRHTVFRDFNNAPESAKKEKMREELKNMHIPLYFLKFASLLEEGGGDYVAGKTLTYGDLALVNFIEVLEDLVDPNCLNEFPTLRALKERIFAIPEIAQWRKEQKSFKAECGYPEDG